ncbi:MAG: hypothetical protein ACO29O_08710, partial [Chitinophagaceae bacterium]
MTQTHIHLLTNHLPIIGSFLGTLVLLYGIVIKSSHTRIASFLIFIVSTIGAVITYLTGEGAEEKVEGIADVSKKMIQQHESFALISLVSLIVLGLTAIIAWILTKKNPIIGNKVALITLFIAILSFALVARTGYLGGQIRHSELRSTIS